MTINHTLEGPIGELFFAKNSNFLYDLGILIWTKYLKLQLEKVEYYYSVNSNYTLEFRDKTESFVNRHRKQIFLGLYNLFKLLDKFKEKDEISFALISLKINKFADIGDNFEVGALVLERAIQYMELIIERKRLFSFDNKINKHIFTAFTTDNIKIKQLFSKASDSFNKKVKELNFIRRKRVTY